MLNKSVPLSLLLFSCALNLVTASPDSQAQTAVTGSWSQVVPEGNFWAERWDFQLVSHQGQLLVVGGQNQTGYLNDIWASSDGLQWQQLPKPGWSARAYFQLVEFNSALFLIDGETAQGMSNEVWVSRDRGLSLGWAISPPVDNQSESAKAIG